jgi:very-short-patch-repair endonuclease
MLAPMAKVAPKTLRRARSLRRTLTNAETILWSRLRDELGEFRFRRQHPIGPYIADFASVRVRLIVEVDGGTHSSDAERAHDERRDAFLRSLSWEVIRVTNDDVYRSLDDVLNFIHGTARALAGRRSRRA